MKGDSLWAQGAAAPAPKLLPLLQTESDYRQARGQAGHWKHRHEQTIRYYLKESSAFQRKMVPLSVTLTIGSSTWHWISHLRRMNSAAHSCALTKIMRALFSLLFDTYKGKFMRDTVVQKLKHAAEFTINRYWMNNSIVFSLLYSCVCVNNTTLPFIVLHNILGTGF